MKLGFFDKVNYGYYGSSLWENYLHLDCISKKLGGRTFSAKKVVVDKIAIELTNDLPKQNKLIRAILVIAKIVSYFTIFLPLISIYKRYEQRKNLINVNPPLEKQSELALRVKKEEPVRVTVVQEVNPSQESSIVEKSQQRVAAENTTRERSIFEQPQEKVAVIQKMNKSTVVEKSSPHVDNLPTIFSNLTMEEQAIVTQVGKTWKEECLYEAPLDYFQRIQNYRNTLVAEIQKKSPPIAEKLNAISLVDIRSCRSLKELNAVGLTIRDNIIEILSCDLYQEFLQIERRNQAVEPEIAAAVEPENAANIATVKYKEYLKNLKIVHNNINKPPQFTTIIDIALFSRSIDQYLETHPTQNRIPFSEPERKQMKDAKAHGFMISHFDKLSNRDERIDFMLTEIISISLIDKKAPIWLLDRINKCGDFCKFVGNTFINLAYNAKKNMDFFELVCLAVKKGRPYNDKNRNDLFKMLEIMPIHAHRQVYVDIDYEALKIIVNEIVIGNRVDLLLKLTNKLEDLGDFFQYILEKDVTLLLRIATNPQIDIHRRFQGTNFILPFLIYQGNIDEALQIINSFPVGSVENDQLHNTCGHVFYRQNKFLEAFEQFSAIRNIELRVGECKVLLTSLILKGHTDVALQLINRFPVGSVENDALHSTCGVFLYEQGKLQEALEQISAIRNERQRCDACKSIISSLIQAGHMPEALQLMNTFQEGSVEKDELHSMSGITLYEQGKLQEALEQISVIRNERQRCDACKSIISSLIQAGHMPEAFQLMNTFQEGSVEKDELHSICGVTLYEQGKLQEALEQISAIRNERQRCDACKSIISSLIQAGHMPEAFQLMNTFQEGSVEKDELHYKCGSAFYIEDKLDQAFEQFIVIRNEEIRYEGCRLIINYFIQKGHIDKVLQLIDSFPEDSVVKDELHYKCGSAFYFEDKLDQAFEQFIAIRIEEIRYKGCKLIIKDLIQKGHIDKVLRLIDSFQDGSDEKDKLHYKCGAAFYEQGKLHESFEQINAMRNLEKRYEGCELIIKELMQKGHINKALQLINGFPEDSEFNDVLRLKIGVEFCNQNKLNEANEQLNAIRNPKIKNVLLLNMLTSNNDIEMSIALVQKITPEENVANIKALAYRLLIGKLVSNPDINISEENLSKLILIAKDYLSIISVETMSDPAGNKTYVSSFLAIFYFLQDRGKGEKVIEILGKDITIVGDDLINPELGVYRILSQIDKEKYAALIEFLSNRIAQYKEHSLEKAIQYAISEADVRLATKLTEGLYGGYNIDTADRLISGFQANGKLEEAELLAALYPDV